MWQPNILGIRRLRGNALVTAYMVVCGIAFMMFGYDQAVVGALSSNPTLLKHMGARFQSLLLLHFFTNNITDH
jgi:hypothetical protein